MWFRALRGKNHYGHFNVSSMQPETSVHRKLILSGCVQNDENCLLIQRIFDILNRDSCKSAVL